MINDRLPSIYSIFELVAYSYFPEYKGKFELYLTSQRFRVVRAFDVNGTRSMLVFVFKKFSLSPLSCVNEQ